MGLGGGVGWWGGGVGPCDYCVSPSPLGLDFGTWGLWTLDLGLTIGGQSRFSSYFSFLELFKRLLECARA